MSSPYRRLSQRLQFEVQLIKEKRRKRKPASFPSGKHRSAPGRAVLSFCADCSVDRSVNSSISVIMRAVLKSGASGVESPGGRIRRTGHGRSRADTTSWANRVDLRIMWIGVPVADPQTLLPSKIPSLYLLGSGLPSFLWKAVRRIRPLAVGLSGLQIGPWHGCECDSWHA